MSAVLEIRSLVKSFGGAEPVLNGIDLTLEQGRATVILGPSGCGKSTLLRCIIGLESIDSGSIRIDGEEAIAGTKQFKRLRRKLGMVFQSYDLFPHLNLMDNITLAPVRVAGRSRAEAEDEAGEWLQRVGLWEKRKMLPRQLSGGQRQRGAIVRALCMHPEVMLFDEVTAALDPEMVREVLDVILNLAANGFSMLLVTHEMAFARAVADEVVFIDQGRIVEQAPPEQFFTAPATARAGEFLKTFTFKRKA